MPNKRKASQDYHDLARERGFKWLGPEGVKAQEKSGWRCEKGHEWEAVFWNIKLGGGCPYCSGKARKTEEDYHKLAKSKGFKWLGNCLVATNKKTLWQCDKEHKFNATFSAIYWHNQGCKECYLESKRLKSEDYHKLAEDNDLEWLGPKVTDSRHKTWWQCPKGHKTYRSYASLRNSKGFQSRCTVCSGRIRKSGEDYAFLAKEIGWEWLGPEVPNNRTLTWWECDKGHRIRKRYDDIRAGDGCRECKRINQTIPPDEYKAIAKSRGFEWLGPEVKKVRIPTYWLCPKGHKFRASYSNIKQGNGCSVCKASKGENAIAKILDELNIRYSRQHSFDKCRCNGNLLYYDFYFMVGAYHILIEYDGLHHFKPIKFWGGKENLEKIRRHDKIKTEFAKRHEFILIRIPYKVKRIKQYLQGEIKKQTGITLSEYTPIQKKLSSVTITPSDYRQLQLRLES